jgi:hypothetical protein
MQTATDVLNNWSHDQNLPAYYADMLSNHMQLLTYKKTESVSANSEVFQKLKSIGETHAKKPNGEWTYFLHVVLEQDLKRSINTDKGKADIVLRDFWFVLQDDYTPVLYIKSSSDQNSPYDKYELVSKTDRNYDWKIWVKEPMEHYDKFSVAIGGI